jgi:4-alpha-glucanotransferase
VPEDNYGNLVDRAASRWGIEAEFWDIWGHLHVTPRETKTAVLEALGVPAGDQGRLAAALDERQRREWTRPLPPCLVASGERKPASFPVRVPASLAGATASVEIRRERGPVDRYEADLAALGVRASAQIDGKLFVEKMVDLPDSLPLGYHELQIRIRSATRAGAPEPCASMRLILAPDRAYMPPSLAAGGRAAGIAVSLYSLRSERNWGCGDFRDLHTLIQWTAEDAEASFVALNPLHAIHNRRPFNTSPYLPLSIFYQNFLYLDIEAIEGFSGSARVQALWNRPETAAEIRRLRESAYVEYEQVASLKLRFLKVLFAEFLRARRRPGSNWERLQAYAAREGDLLDSFATYCALDETLHRRNPDLWIWPDWPAEFRDPASPAVAGFRKRHRTLILFYKYVQWQIEMQLEAAQRYARDKGLPIGLYHDLALATDRCGSDLWAHRAFYVAGCRVGSPPDDFAPKGQDWAFPPPDHDRHRESGYRLFTESIRKNCRHGGALRIDHVMRFFRLFWIPDALEATEGAYVKDHAEDLVRILALESVRNKVLVVGEDLGTVEPHIRETLARFGVLSYRLLYFEKNSNNQFKPALEYPVQSLVSVSTHDLPTLAGFWIGADIDERRRVGLIPDEAAWRAQREVRAREKQTMLDLLFRENLLPAWHPRVAADLPELTGELHNAIVGFLATTPSTLMLVTEEDLTKETAQQNLPGTTWQHPNWSRKMKYTVEELRSAQAARDFTAMFRNWVERTGRARGQLRRGQEA